MRNSYLQNLINEKTSREEIDQINKVYRSLLKASQHEFFARDHEGRTPVFPIAEGIVRYDPDDERGVFVPSKTFRALLQNAREENVSNLISREVDRFGKLVELAYFGEPISEDITDGKKDQTDE